MPKYPAPTGLAKAGRKHWRAIAGIGTYELRPDELAILEAACREADVIALIEEKMETEELMVPGSMGQMVVNPLVQELRLHRTVFVQSMAKLKLPDEPGGDAEVNQNRAAAKARWAVG